MASERSSVCAPTYSVPWLTYEVVGKIVAEIREIERLFDAKLLQPDVAKVILDQARDLLILRNLQALGQGSSLRETNLKLEARTAALQDA